MKREESIVLNLELYPSQIIAAAAKEYSKFCTVNLEQAENKMVCSFFSCEIPADLIGLEFGNYLFELMRQRNSV